MTNKTKIELTPVEVELLEKARKGDRAAGGQLLMLAERLAFKKAYGILRNRQSSEEVVQDAMLCAWRTLPRFNGRSSFACWLAGVATNMARRVRRNAMPCEREVDPDLDLDDRLNAEEEILQIEQEAALDRKIAELPPVEQYVLSLQTVGDVSTAEVAKVLSLGVRNVEKKVKKATDNLVEQMNPPKKAA